MPQIQWCKTKSGLKLVNLDGIVYAEPAGEKGEHSTLYYSGFVITVLQPLSDLYVLPTQPDEFDQPAEPEPQARAMVAAGPTVEDAAALAVARAHEAMREAKAAEAEQAAALAKAEADAADAAEAARLEATPKKTPKKTGKR